MPHPASNALLPGEPGYDEARRVFNAMIDRRPALIARCRRPADVQAALAHARERDLPVAVHGGGHGVTGAAVCDGGVMIDLRPMRGVLVDPGRRIAVVQGGATWRDVDAATTPHGLAVTGGRVPSTGVAGLALGSGSGWLERMYGLTCDSLIAADVLTAGGRLVRASAEENADLFWGLRGGGGNFGIVVAFHLRLHPVPPAMLAGMLLYPAERGAEVTAAYRDFMESAADETGGALAFITAPPGPPVPEPARGRPAVGIIALHVGAVEEGERALAPLRALGLAADLLAPMPYLALQGLLEPSAPPGLRNWWTADFLSELERTAPWNVHFLGMWPDAAADAENFRWVRRVAGAMKPWATGGVYLNFIGDEGAERVRAGFGAERWARLVAIKDRWDPGNVFRLNQNIPPSATNLTPASSSTYSARS